MHDVTAFDEYAAAQLRGLFGFACVLTGDRGTAEDVVQDVLLTVHRQWAKIETLEHRDAYVRRMVVNEYLSWRRRWSRIVPVADVHLTDEPTTGEVSGRDDLDSEMAKLPRRQFAALTLRYYGGYTDAEIADMLGCRPVTVRGYISRALRTLRVELDPVGHDDLTPSSAKAEDN